jgi:hypothetical protein
LFAAHSLVIATAFQLDLRIAAWSARVAAKAALLVTSAALCMRCVDVSPRALLQALMLFTTFTRPRS